MRILLPLASCLCLIFCGSAPKKGGLEGQSKAISPQPELPPLIQAPNGEWIVSHSQDDLGYVLPLDVLRPKSPKTPRDQILSLPYIQQFGTNFSIQRLGLDDGHSQNETSIDALGEVAIAGWNQATTDSIVMGVARSLDGGDSWTWQNLTGFDVMSDPIVASSGGSQWFYAYLARSGSSDIEIYVQRSTDNGLSWQAPVPVTNNAVFDDKPNMAAQGNMVLVAWADFGFSPAKVSSAVSLDAGQTFIRHTVLANNSVGGNGASTIIDGSGNLYVFWRDSMQQFLWMSKSTDQGLTWSPDTQISAMSPLPSTLPPGFRIVNLPSAAVDPATGDLCVVWNDQAFGDGDILSVRSTDGGDNWSSAVRVNDDSSGHPQFFPWMDVDEDGVFHIIWYDMRTNGSDIDVYYAFSEDGGQTFSANEPVTSSAFTPILPWEGGLSDFIGDYNGLAVTSEKVFAFYQDSRRNEQDVYVAVMDREPALTYPEMLALWPEPISVIDLIGNLP